jgi:hypothetical protein
MVVDNLEAFPNQNTAGRTLIRDLEARIAEAVEFINSQN